MKNLKEYIVEGIFDIDDNINNVDESVKELIKRFLKDNFDGASSCKISDKPNADGKYEVSSSKDITVINKKITSLTNKLFIWIKVVGDFDCSLCKSLTSLEGAPKTVGGFFDCSSCKSLTSLEGAPEKVGGIFDCRYCNLLKSLKGSPKEVKKDFCCIGCDSLTSLEGSPKEIGGDFLCWGSYSLTSLEGAPKKVSGSFNCSNCYRAFTTDDVKKVSDVDKYIYV